MNIYDVRKENNLLFILPRESNRERCLEINKRVAIIMYLYYLETLETYVKYINGIPRDIVVYVYSSNEIVLKRIDELVNRNNLFLCLKKNRGRDISALLVEAKAVVETCDYVCFIHDKRANAEYLKKDVEYWITNLWENTIATEEYITEVLCILEENPLIGMLVPPEPYGEYLCSWYGGTWEKNYDSVCELATELNIALDVDRNKPVFTLGTVFWARTIALKKLFDKKWEYKDFPEEPMPLDGTISHAIERILGYVVQDAGYQTGTIMTDGYASRFILNVQEDMREMFYCLKNELKLHDIHQLKTLDDRKKMIKEFISKYSNIYIYGAGDYGATLYKLIEDSGLTCDGFVVSKGNRKTEVYLGKKVWEIQELTPNENTGIVIGVYYSHRNQIEETLNSMGFSNYIYGF